VRPKTAMRERVDDGLHRCQRHVVTHRPERDAEQEVGRLDEQGRRPIGTGRARHGGLHVGEVGQHGAYQFCGSLEPDGAHSAMLAFEGLQRLQAPPHAVEVGCQRVRQVREAPAPGGQPGHEFARGDLAFVAEGDVLDFHAEYFGTGFGDGSGEPSPIGVARGE
jgi:hypothetical protein